MLGGEAVHLIYTKVASSDASNYDMNVSWMYDD